MAAHREKKKSRAGRIAMGVLLAVCIGVFLFSAYMLLSDYIEKRESQDAVDGVKRYVTVSTRKGSAAAADGEQQEAAEPFYEVDFDALRAINGDIYGWIILPDTIIDYPVMQDNDNEYYLRHTFEKKANRCGSIFVDKDNARELGDANTVIHGHRMRNGSMFGTLDRFADPAYFAAHPVLYLATPQAYYRLEVFAAYEARWDAGQTQQRFASEEEYAAFIESCRGRSVIAADVEMTPADKMVTLSTCTAASNENRFIVHARAVKLA